MWSHKTIHIGLSVQQIVFAETGAAWPRQAAACHRINCGSHGAEETDAEPWRPAVAALAGWLAGKGKDKSTLRIVLSGRFVRWQLLPWRAELTQPKELAAHAALRFRETFGKVVEDWHVRHALPPPGKTVPACAVDAALLKALHSACADTGAHLAAVTPYFASAFDRWRNALKGNKGKVSWFGLIEPDCLSLGLLHDGNWLGLRTQRLDGNGENWREVLSGMMAQIGIPAGLATGLNEAAVPLYLAGGGESPAPAEDLPFTWLRPEAQAKSAMAGCRMALGV